jgi:hypothetical protein
MKLKAIAFLLLMNFHFISSAQSELSSYHNFMNILVDNYKKFSKPPLDNYYVILSNTAKTSFSIRNPYFIKALASISKENKISEQVALDTLFVRSFKDLRSKSIWVSSPTVFENEKEFFKIYNTKICPCLTKNVSKDDDLQKMVKVQQACIAGVILDTSFTNEIKLKAGSKTINDLYKLQSYFAMYFYENCDILNYKFNESFKNSIVYERYEAEVSSEKIRDVEKVIRFFKTNKIDSLKILFPNFLKFKNELTKIVQYANNKGTTFRPFYTGTFNGSEKNIMYTLITKDKVMGDFVFFNTSSTFYTNITALKYKSRKQFKNRKEEIIEISADEVITTIDK